MATRSLGVSGLDVAFAELGAKAFQRPDLFVGQVNLPARDVFFQAKQAAGVLGQKVVAAPDAAHAARREDLDALQH